MLRSVPVRRGSAAAAFLSALQRDLFAFGRTDTTLVTVGELTLFVWDAKVKPIASEALRHTSFKFRLRERKIDLHQIEASLPSDFFVPFTIRKRPVLAVIRGIRRDLGNCGLTGPRDQGAIWVIGGW